MIYLKQIIKNILILLGLFWLFTEIIDYFFSSISVYIKNDIFFWWAFSIIFFISTIISIPRNKITVKISGVDSKITLLRRNLPKRKVDLAIASSNYFNTDLKIISKDSLLGQYVSYHKLDCKEMYSQISESLNNIESIITNPKKGNKNSYPVGSVASFKNKNNYIFLLAITNILDDGNKVEHESNPSYVELAFANLWKEARNKVDDRYIHLPLIGAGIGKSYQRAIDSIIFICTSYIEESRDKKINSGINIYLRKKDITVDEFEKLKCIVNLLIK